jgi:hypothetical protein
MIDRRWLSSAIRVESRVVEGRDESRDYRTATANVSSLIFDRYRTSQLRYEIHRVATRLSERAFGEFAV